MEPTKLNIPSDPEPKRPKVFLVTSFEPEAMGELYNKWDLFSIVAAGGFVCSTLEKAKAKVNAYSQEEWEEARKDYEVEKKDDDLPWKDWSELVWNPDRVGEIDGIRILAAVAHPNRPTWIALDENAGTEVWWMIQELEIDPE